MKTLSVNRIYVGDNLSIMRTWPDDSVDAVVTDPPYELSDDGKACANRVFLKMMFPHVADFNPEVTTQDELPMLISQVLRLNGVRKIPCPSPSVKVRAVALNGEVSPRNKNIQNGDKASIWSSNGKGRNERIAEGAKHLGDFYLEFTDSSTVLDGLNRAGCCFYAGGLGVGFRVKATSLPGFFPCGDAVVVGDHSVGTINNALTYFVGAVGTTEEETVPAFDLGRGAKNYFSACSALKFLAAITQTGSKIVRAPTRAGSLSSKFQAIRICVVGPSTDRTFSFNLLSHALSIQGKGFMGKRWDGSKIAHDVALWREVLRVLKPGGHLLSFGGTRTYHRMACAIEDAGFEIRDQILWVYSQGFPKSQNVGKMLDKRAGAVRKQIGVSRSISCIERGYTKEYVTAAENSGFGTSAVFGLGIPISMPATNAAKRWDGWGTALKPAVEPLVVARKPLSEKTVAANVLRWGTGAINIDASRIQYLSDADKSSATPQGKCSSKESAGAEPDAGRGLKRVGFERPELKGRWPANIVLDEEAARLLDQQSGILKSGSMRGVFKGTTKSTSACFGEYGYVWRETQASSGGASRFFYCSKASRKDRGVGNNHATVKPTSLMEYLIRLVTPPGGIVLDPFLGSGTTAVAATRLGFSWLGCEQSPEYVKIAESRLVAERGVSVDIEEIVEDAGEEVVE